ncbi:nuclear envelope pore membrane protein POM 121 [Discoglossus pictus]
MCPSGGRAGRRWEQLWREVWGSSERRVLLLAVFLFLLLLCIVPYYLVLALLCLAACWGYLDQGRLRSGLAVWRQITGLGRGGAPGKRQGINPIRRHREPSVFKWSPADLLILMGSYLGKQEPPPRALGRGARELKDQLSRPNPTVPTPTRRLSFRETPTVYSNRTYMSPRRRYPTHQPQYSMTGSLPMVCLDGYHRKTLLSPRNSVVRSPVTVTIAPPDSNIARSPVLDHLLSPYSTSPSTHTAPDPCAKETVLSAIRESRKRMNKDEEYSTLGGLENKRRRQYSSGSGHSPFDSMLVNGAPSSLVTKPDNLKRGLGLQVLDDHASKRSRASSNSSLSGSVMNGVPMPAHNAITSSYSSSRGLQKRKRNVQNTSIISSTPSSRCQTPEWPVKKAREEEMHETSQSTPVKSARDQSGKLHETPVSKSCSLNSDTGSSGGGGRRRKVLLVCPGRQEQYPLPPPPLLGYSITSEDFDSEKKAALQRLNKALEDTTDSAPNSSVTASTSASVLRSSLTITLATTASQSLVSQTTSASSNPLLQSLAKMQNQESSSGPTVAVTPNNTPATNTVPNMPLGSFALNLNTTEAKPSIVSNSTPSVYSPASAVVTSGISSSSSLSQPLVTAQPKQELPKNGLLFEILSKPEEKNPQSSFKPIFGPIPTTSTATVPPSADLTSTSATATTFKPIFGNLGSQPATSSASSSFAFQVTATSTASVPSFPSLSGTGTSTALNTDTSAKPSFALSNSTSSSTTAPAFQFGVASQSLSTSSGTSLVMGNNPVTTTQAKPAAPFGQTTTSQPNANLNIFGSTQAAPASTAQPQPPTAFGSATSAFTAAFGSTTNPPSFSGNTGLAAFNNSKSDGQTTKPTATALPNFGGSLGQPAFGTSTQPAFGGSSQPTFGSSSQPAFGGSANATFNFASSTPAATKTTTFGSASSTQSSNNTTNANMFGSGTQQSSFSFSGTANTAMPFGSGTQSNSTAGSSGFNFGAQQSSAPGTAASFGSSSVAQNSIGTPNRSTPFGFGATENKLPFGGSSTPTFGQSTSTPGALSFGTPTPGFSNPKPSFSPATPSFSIGAGSKPAGARQRLQARRQHPRKK